MKTKLIIFLCCLSFWITATSQTYLEEVLSQIKSNNTAIPAIKKMTQAEQLAAATALYLPDPTIEIALFNGNPASIGTRTDFSLRQQFDFPTTYAHRSKLAGITHQYLLSKAEESKQQILMQAVLLYLQAVETNQLIVLAQHKASVSHQISEALQKSLEAGNIGILEANQARMFSMNTIAELTLLQSELQQKLSALKKMNGGKDLIINGFSYPDLPLPDDFDTWYQQAATRIPALNAIQLEKEAAKKNEQLQLALSLPGFEAGYQSEKFMNESFRGFVAGIRLPLMESRNNVKAAKMHRIAIEEIEKDLGLQFRHDMKALYEQAYLLGQQWRLFELEAQKTDIRPLLQSARENGEINLFSFLYQSGQYHENLVMLEQLKGRYYKAVAQLYMYEW